MKSVGEILIVRPNFVAAEGKKDSIPTIGTLLKTNSARDEYLIVSDQFIESRIPGRVPTAYGLDYDMIDEEQPQSNFLLRWMFEVNPICSKKGEALESFDRVPAIHSLLYELTNEEMSNLISNPVFVDFLFRIDENLLPQRNEVLMKCFKKYIQTLNKDKRDEEALRILSRVSVILRNDYSTLKKFANNLEASI
ncbi:MAG: hypothetical protein ACP5SB_06505 [Caldisericaceae bacterium]